MVPAKDTHQTVDHGSGHIGEPTNYLTPLSLMHQGMRPIACHDTWWIRFPGTIGNVQVNRGIVVEIQPMALQSGPSAEDGRRAGSDGQVTTMR
ncbi:hypothetical protein [Corynebacterium hindlerae]|uniref:hypothetical protein n=1 Tax=Corynebacterium hindlerae TaxID=699041 RepID=UPI003AB0729A